MTNFKFPPYFDYEPFFTKQLNEDARKKQVELWESLILAFFAAIQKNELDVSTALDNVPFRNSKINRGLDRAQLVEYLDGLAKKEKAVWINKEKTRCRIVWKSVKEWGELIHTAMKKRGALRSTYPFGMIVYDDENSEEVWYRMPMDLFKDAMLYLQKKGKAVLSELDSPDLRYASVTFI